MNTHTPTAEVIRLAKKKPKSLAENAGLLAFSIAEPAPVTDIAPRIRAKRQAAPLQDRIDRLTDKSAGPDGVWNWRGSRNQSNDYPQISFTDPATGKYVTKPVHRVLMEIKLGRKLSRDEFVLHARGVSKQSVNPAHLRIGSRDENTADAHAEGRFKRGHLKPADVLKIVHLRQKHGVDIADLAHRFGVKAPTIRDIVQGRSHSKITGIQYVQKTTGRPAKAVLQVEHQSKRGKPSAPRVLEAVI